MRSNPMLGVLGGTALLALDLKDIKHHQPMTPFGPASAQLVEGTLPNGYRIVFLPRHGPNHTIAPSQVNYRGNVYRMKELGVTHLLSISAVGSLEEVIKPGSHLVIPDQLFDDTRGFRARTFFDEGMAVHVGMGEPFCPAFRNVLIQSANQCQVNRVHTTGTLVVIEGPQFSTRAKSLFYKYQVPEAAVIGMTASPEAELAAEAGLHYGIACLPADYDAWRSGQAVTADEVKAGLAGFGDAPLRLVSIVTEMMSHPAACNCNQALQGFAVHTHPEARPDTDTNRLLGVPRGV